MSDRYIRVEVTPTTSANVSLGTSKGFETTGYEGGYDYIVKRNRRIALRRAIIVIFAMMVIWGAGIWLMA
jgi:hypothetical protein